MPRHDLICTNCLKVLLDENVVLTHLPICECRGEYEILWTAPSRGAAVHEKERVVVWEHPLTGEVRYPGRNDAPIPTRYREQGYVRKELSSLREVERFEKQHGVRNQAVWYDRGSGRDDFGD